MSNSLCIVCDTNVSCHFFAVFVKMKHSRCAEEFVSASPILTGHIRTLDGWEVLAKKCPPFFFRTIWPQAMLQNVNTITAFSFVASPLHFLRLETTGNGTKIYSYIIKGLSHRFLSGSERKSMEKSGWNLDFSLDVINRFIVGHGLLIYYVSTKEWLYPLHRPNEHLIPVWSFLLWKNSFNCVGSFSPGTQT